MGTVTAQIFASLDGVVESPERWHFPYLDDDMLASVEQHLLAADILLLGGATYDTFATSWPNQPRNTALSERINSMPKVVATSRSETLGWENSTILGGPLADKVPQLTETYKTVAVVGSIRLVRSLLDSHLLDELHIMIHPIVLNTGVRLFESGSGRMPLTLVAAETFSTGVINTRYHPSPVDATVGGNH